MYMEADLFTVYEIYEQNESKFPFWIRATVNSQTCMFVTGWSKYIDDDVYKGIPHLTKSSIIWDTPEINNERKEDFLESGSFVGICYYSDKKTLIKPQSEKLISVEAGSTRM